MARKFKTVDYEAMLKQTVSIEVCLPPTHLARFVVQTIARLDLSSIYQEYGVKGGIAIAPEILLRLLFYGYATGVFSSRALEQATYESIPFRFIAGNLHPDHDTIAHFRSRFIARRQCQLDHLAQAPCVLQERAQQRYEQAQSEYAAKIAEREAYTQQTGRQPRGRVPAPPLLTIGETEQYNFSDPESRIMKNSGNQGFDQHYNAQLAVDQRVLLSVSNTLSNHPNDQLDALPTIDAIHQGRGQTQASRLRCRLLQSHQC